MTTASLARLPLAAVLADLGLTRAAAAKLQDVQLTTAGGKSDVTIHWYEADHAFANPSSARYDDADAKLSWKRTTAFFKENPG